MKSLIAVLALAACGGGAAKPTKTPSNTAQTTDPTPPPGDECADGQEYLESGCGGDTLGPQLPAHGCYARCPMMDCEIGYTCKMVVVNPCPDGTCDACSADAQVCLPDA
jgi:hypothetical protein